MNVPGSAMGSVVGYDAGVCDSCGGVTRIEHRAADGDKWDDVYCIAGCAGETAINSNSAPWFEITEGDADDAIPPGAKCQGSGNIQVHAQSGLPLVVLWAAKDIAVGHDPSKLRALNDRARAVLAVLK